MIKVGKKIDLLLIEPSLNPSILFDIQPELKEKSKLFV